jgi:hypothetical protein
VVDNVVYLVDWRIKREVEALRREIMSGKVASVSADRPGVGLKRNSFESARVLDLMAYRRLASRPRALGSSL